MTNLEWLIKGSYIEKHEGIKGDKLIINCESGKLKELSSTNQNDVLKWLLSEHRTDQFIKLTESEYRVIKILKKGNFPLTILKKEILEKIHYKEFVDDSIQMQNILANCEIVQDDYEF